MLKKLIGIAVIATACCLAPSSASAQISISVRIGPPVLPVYVQPACPTPGYLWTPGYWAYGPMGYYWVPGVWIAPPQVGFLWTPGYWGFVGGIYSWNAGYWGPHVGFYGGVNYGFGYVGHGFYGGGWVGNVYRYNTAVTNVNTTVIHNTYVNRTVINNTTINRVSYNGPGGVVAQPNAQERQFAHEQHIQPTSNQVAQERSASQDHGQLASVNHGQPAYASMSRVGGARFTPQARPFTANPQPAAQQQPRVAQAGGGHPQPQPNANAQRQPNNNHPAPQERHAANREPRPAAREEHREPK